MAFFSKRFAAKEAFSKALGTGISKGINFNEIIVLNEKNGKPYILENTFSGKKLRPYDTRMLSSIAAQIVLIPILPSGSFFSTFNGTLFWVIFSIGNIKKEISFR